MRLLFLATVAGALGAGAYYIAQVTYTRLKPINCCLVEFEIRRPESFLSMRTCTCFLFIIILIGFVGSHHLRTKTMRATSSLMDH